MGNSQGKVKQDIGLSLKNIIFMVVVVLVAIAVINYDLSCVNVLRLVNNEDCITVNFFQQLFL